MHPSTDNNHPANRFQRGYSKCSANEEITTETRNQIEKNFKSDTLSSSSSTSSTQNNNNNNSSSSSSNPYHHRLYIPNEYSFMLPDLNRIDDYKFREYLQNDLIEIPTECALTESGHLNWWTQNDWEGVCKPLYPMSTSGDGNCLLHAASLAMWGLHDRSLVLRKALHSTLENIKENNSPLWRRWKWEQMCQNKKYNLIFSDEEWSREWNSLLKLSSYKPRVSLDNVSNGETVSLVNLDGQVYFESLEEFHVFLLAHILQRPIIIVSDTMLHDADGQPLAPIPFGGIYLPFECEVNSCQRFPLVLAYDSAHFSALVLMNDQDLDYSNLRCPNFNDINKILHNRVPYSCIPLTYSNNEMLPLHFKFDPGENFDWARFDMTQSLNRNEEMSLIQKYLDLVRIELLDPSNYTIKKNLPSNTSGLKINISNIRVKELIRSNQAHKTSNNKLQKFFMNIFKTNEDKSEILNKNVKKSKNFFKTIKTGKIVSQYENRPETLDPYGQPEVLSYSKIAEGIGTSEPEQNIFHKIKEYNNWQEVFGFLELKNQKNMLCCKLNLIKPNKYDVIIHNYIDSAKQKYLMLVRQSEIKNKPTTTYQIPVVHNQQHSNESNNQIRNIQIKNTSTFLGDTNPVQYSYNHQHDRKKTSYF
ncbi:unnamed protein product [Brachionus calyciflorus]|uniref:ubiquitinyl hydrolase 1 n=1 Tax=Brachionus calyciflorus TaxID=104777 RepID=A0A813TXZ9_9BILA|nr:unnamed protein product [Brachionus calyciflorus]